jgi:hypothetical protein
MSSILAYMCCPSYDAGDTYEPQAWNQFMQKMDKWSDKWVSVDSWPGSMLSKCSAILRHIRGRR